MCGHEGGGGGEFYGEIAVGDGVNGILAESVESECFCDSSAVYGESDSGERAGAEWREIQAFSAIGESSGVSLEHIIVGEEVVSEDDGLCGLHVCHTGGECIGVFFGEFEECESCVGD